MATEVGGFPQSSNELDQWKKQGRTFSGGKWYEKGTPTGGGLKDIEAGIGAVATQTQALVDRVKTEGITVNTETLQSNTGALDVPEIKQDETTDYAVITNDVITPPTEPTDDKEDTTDPLLN